MRELLTVSKLLHRGLVGVEQQNGVSANQNVGSVDVDLPTTFVRVVVCVTTQM